MNLKELIKTNKTKIYDKWYFATSKSYLNDYIWFKIKKSGKIVKGFTLVQKDKYGFGIDSDCYKEINFKKYIKQSENNDNWITLSVSSSQTIDLENNITHEDFTPDPEEWEKLKQEYNKEVYLININKKMIRHRKALNKLKNKKLKTKLYWTGIILGYLLYFLLCFKVFFYA